MQQQGVNVCEERRQSASDDTTFLPRAINGDEGWIYGYDHETMQQSSEWKSPKSRRPKTVKQMTNKEKSMSIGPDRPNSQFRKLL
jgi:hypothetical protein